MESEAIKELMEDINSGSKASKKRALEKLLLFLENGNEFNAHFSDNDELQRAIFKSLTDKYERCREIACEIITLLVTQQEQLIKQQLGFVFQIISRRLSEEEDYEPSEEVRIKFLTLLVMLYEKFPSECEPFLEDTLLILATSLEDKCPDIKKKAAGLVVTVSRGQGLTTRKVMRARGETLVPPLSRNISHRQAAVRAVTVSAIGSLGLATPGDVLEAVASHMAQRVFDPSPAVRMEHVKVMGAWLKALPDRYSYFYKLAPLLLVSLEDEMTEVKELAARLWDEAGLQWLEENKMNDARLKDEMDFLTEDPEHYPSWHQRPNLGCRTLVARIQHQVYPSINNDLKDWQVESRLKAGLLLYLMLWHSEQDVVMHTEKILNCLVTAARDEEMDVRDWAVRGAEMLGFMLTADTWVPFMIQRLGEEASREQILVLSGLIRGANPRTLCSELLRELLDRVSPDMVTLTRQEQMLEQLGALTQAVVTCIKPSVTPEIMETVLEMSRSSDDQLIEKDNGAPSKNDAANVVKNIGTNDPADYKTLLDGLVKINLAVRSLSQDPGTLRQALECQEALVQLTSMTSLTSLYLATLPSLLVNWLEASLTWSPSSPDLDMFRHLLTSCGDLTGHFPRTVVRILTNLCSVDTGEAATRLASLILLSRLLLNLTDTLDSQGIFSPCLLSVVTDIVAPSLKWQAGRTASAVRTAAASSLWSACVAAANNPASLANIFSVVEARILGLVSDDSDKTRLFSLRTLTILMTSNIDNMDRAFIVKAAKEISDALDDKSFVNREECVRCLGSYLHTVAKLKEKQGLEEADVKGLDRAVTIVLSGLTLHMDDDNEQLRDIILGSLISLPLNIQPALKVELNKCVASHRHKKHIETLLNTISL